jgi:hypothetical protein
MFYESALVLECITLAQVVKLVVQMFVNLATGPVLRKEASQDAESAHPQHLTEQYPIRQPNRFQMLLYRQPHSPRHASILGTLPLAKASVPADTPRLVQCTGTGARVDGDGLLDDQAVLR